MLLLKGEKKAPSFFATNSAFFFPLYPLSTITSPKNLNGLRSFLRNGLSFLLELEILKFAISKLQRLTAMCILSQSFFRTLFFVLMQNQMLLPTSLIPDASSNKSTGFLIQASISFLLKLDKRLKLNN